MTTLLDLDRALLEGLAQLESAPLTAVFAVVSAWWVKGPLLVAMGLAGDLWRRRAPIAFAAATAALLTASASVAGLKEVFDRERPPLVDPELGGLVATPGTASFPSGHSATAFAAATAVALLCPRLRWVALAIAAAVALSRVYLQVHFPLDVLAGGLFGAALGAGFALLALRLVRAPEPPRAGA